MPAIHKLLPMAAALILLIGVVGQLGDVTAMEQPDTTDYILDQTDREDPVSDLPAIPEKPSKPPPYPTVAGITPDLTGLVRESRRENRDTIGWLTIPGTDIDRPILQNPAALADNTFYLTHDMDKQPDRDGCFCTDFRVQTGNGSRAELSRNTTIYGHSWTDDPDGDLFAQLKRYRDPDFARKNPYVFYSTATETMAWEVFAVFDATIQLPYITPDPSERRFYDTLDLIYELSLYSYDSAVAPDDKVLTLSTCTYSIQNMDKLPDLNDYRFVVMAKLATQEAELKKEAVFALNDGRISPDEIAGRMAEW